MLRSEMRRTLGQVMTIALLCGCAADAGYRAQVDHADDSDAPRDIDRNESAWQPDTVHSDGLTSWAALQPIATGPRTRIEVSLVVVATDGTGTVAVVIMRDSRLISGDVVDDVAVGDAWYFDCVVYTNARRCSRVFHAADGATRTAFYAQEVDDTGDQGDVVVSTSVPAGTELRLIELATTQYPDVATEGD